MNKIENHQGYHNPIRYGLDKIQNNQETRKIINNLKAIMSNILLKSKPCHDLKSIICLKMKIIKITEIKMREEGNRVASLNGWEISRC